MINKAATKTEKMKMESDYGVRYSYLFELPYFDPVRMHVVDPMHNLLLGTSKHMFSTWIKQNIIDEKKDVDKFSKLQKKVSVPSGYGRLPHNTVKARKRMKAEEWKTFTLVYSLFCLRKFLTKEQFDHWNKFVNASKIACKRSITVEEIETIHSNLIDFCQGIERIYGKEVCTPNTHLHLHLKQCMIDFGPVFSFWCFSFERFNGILGNYHTNKKDIVITTMRVFCKEAKINSLDHSEYISFLPAPKLNKIDLRKILLFKNSARLVYFPSDFEFLVEPKSLLSKNTLKMIK